MLTLLLSIALLTIHADEIAIPDDEVVRIMHEQSKTWWNTSDSAKKSQVCNDLNSTYKNKGYKCKPLTANIASFNPVPIPEKDLNTIVDFLSYKGTLDVNPDNCTVPVQLQKKAAGQLYLATPASIKIDKIDLIPMDMLKEQLKTMVSKRYKTFVKAYGCDGKKANVHLDDLAGITIFSMNFVETPEKLAEEFIKDLQTKFTAITDATDANQAYIAYTLKNLKNKPFCSNVFRRGWECPRLNPNTITCPSIKLTSKFKSNKWNIDEPLWSKEEEGENRLALRCVRASIGKGLKVSKIIINTSSDSRSNTGGLCAKDFLGLSKKRAEAIKNKIKIALAGEGYTEASSLAESIFRINYYGANKDGTDGPCAHVIDETGIMTDQMIPELTEDVLAKHRSADATIYFAPANNTDSPAVASQTHNEGYISIVCRDIDFSCKVNNVDTGKIGSRYITY